jgi:hypothetical protein
MSTFNNDIRELSASELDEVAGGTGIIEGIIDTAVKIWNIITTPAPVSGPPGGHGSGTGGGNGHGAGLGNGPGNGLGPA